MKKILVLLLAVALLVVASSAFAAIANTKHNLTTSGFFTTKATVDSITMCGFCHVPHGAATGSDLPPLWGRTMNTGLAYRVYGAASNGLAGVTASNTVVNAVPGNHSLTCLSCHDGAWGIAVVTKNGVNSGDDPTFAGNVVAGTSRLDNAAFALSAYNPVVAAGGDLSNDHPVGLTYTGLAASKAGLIAKDAGATVTGASGAIYPLYGAGAQMECGTCHDPHQQDSGTRIKFLRGDTALICQDCHANK